MADLTDDQLDAIAEDATGYEGDGTQEMSIAADRALNAADKSAGEL